MSRESVQASSLFSDEEIQAFLDQEHGDTWMAAALALDTIADNQDLLLLKIKVTGLETDGPAVANELRRGAQTLRMRSEMATDIDDQFDWAEMLTSPGQYAQRLFSQGMREL
jgi:hypothetical protein